MHTEWNPFAMNSSSQPLRLLSMPPTVSWEYGRSRSTALSVCRAPHPRGTVLPFSPDWPEGKQKVALILLGIARKYGPKSGFDAAEKEIPMGEKNKRTLGVDLDRDSDAHQPRKVQP